MVETVGSWRLPGISGRGRSRLGELGWASGGGAPVGRPGRGIQVGDVLSGVYEIRDLVGTGGAGRVYEAYDRLLDRMVAIRTAEQHGMAGGLCVEARALASLRAPMGLGVYAMGNHGGIEYVVMERLFGLSLEERMRASVGLRPFALHEVIRILLGVAWSLAAAHRGGVIHRRLAPENIMLEAGNRVVLLAGGTSACQRDHAEASPYLAPELRAGGAVEPGPAADIYALGVLAFALVTGRPPRSRDDVGLRLEAEIDEMLAGDRRPRPSPGAGIPAPAGGRAELAVHVGRIVSEMMARDPARRPGDAAMIALWLQALARAYDLAIA